MCYAHRFNQTYQVKVMGVVSMMVFFILWFVSDLLNNVHCEQAFKTGFLTVCRPEDNESRHL